MRSKVDWRSFEDARKFARSLKLSNQKEWFEFCKTTQKPTDIPANTTRTYKKEWKGWGDFLGTGNRSNKETSNKFRTFNKSKKFVKKLNLQSVKFWREYCKSGNKPDDIPASPSSYYKKKKSDEK